MAGLSTVGEYTRGSEVVSHYLAMFRASVARQSVFVLVISVAASVGSMAVEMGDARSHLPEYVDAWLREDVIADFERRLVGSSKFAAGRIGRLAPMFGGRSVPFLTKQAAMRAAFFFVIGWPLLAAVLIAIGKALRTDRFLRGAHLVDTTTRAYQQRALRRAVSNGLAGALLGAFALPLLVTGGNGVGVMRLLATWLAGRVSPVATFLSAKGDGAAIWTYAGGRGGFLAPDAAYALVRDAVGWSVAGLAGVGLLGATAGATVGLVWARRKGLAEVSSDVAALRLGGVVIPRVNEVSHFLVSGVVRVGKSVAIKRWLDTIRDRGQRAIVWDPKGEYIERYYRPGKDIILNPFDERSACWTPWADADDMATYESLGKSLFPDDLSRDKFWAMGGALIFAWLVERVGKRLWKATGRPMRECPYNQELAYVLNHTEMEELQEELQGSPAARYMSKNAAAMSQSFLGTLATNLSPFLYLRNLREGERAFSIREFVQDDSSDAWIFISSDPKRFDAVRPLVSLWYDLAINAVLALPDNRSDAPIEEHRRIFAVLDELASLQVLPALDPALTVGASKGLSLILGLQSLEQMKDTYGHHKAMTLLGQPQTRLVLRTVESTTAKWLEEELGKREIERTTESQQMGADTQRDGVGLAKHRHLESLVVYSQIQSLPKLTGYLSMAGEPVKKVRYTWPELRGEAPGLVPVASLPEATPPPWKRAQSMMEESKALARQGDFAKATSKAQGAAELYDPERDAEQLSEALQRVDMLQRGEPLETFVRLEDELATAEKLRGEAHGQEREHLENWIVDLRERLRRARAREQEPANANASQPSPPPADGSGQAVPTAGPVENAAQSSPGSSEGHPSRATALVAEALTAAAANKGKDGPDLDLGAELTAVNRAIELASGIDRQRLEEWAQGLRGRVKWRAIREGRKRNKPSRSASECSVAPGGDTEARDMNAPARTTEAGPEVSPGADTPQEVTAVLANAAANKGKDSPDLDLTTELAAANRAIELAGGRERKRLEEWAQGLRGRMKWRAIREGRQWEKMSGSGAASSKDPDDDKEALDTTAAVGTDDAESGPSPTSEVNAQTDTDFGPVVDSGGSSPCHDARQVGRPPSGSDPMQKPPSGNDTHDDAATDSTTRRKENQTAAELTRSNNGPSKKAALLWYLK